MIRRYQNWVARTFPGAASAARPSPPWGTLLRSYAVSLVLQEPLGHLGRSQRDGASTPLDLGLGCGGLHQPGNDSVFQKAPLFHKPDEESLAWHSAQLH